MASPQSGSPGTLVPPDAPDVAHDADDAVPGEVEKIKAQQRETKTGKYGSQPITPYKKDPGHDQPPKTHWIAIKLVDEDDNPVPGERYKIALPDNSVAEGTLDAKGCARLNAIDPGQCQVSFPKLDADCWEKA